MKCEKCAAEMAALLYSMYCPNKLCNLIWTFGNEEWRVARVGKMEQVPSWAKRGWYLSSFGSPEENSSTPIEMLETLLKQKWGRLPGWEVEERHRSGHLDREMLVFARKA